MSTQFEVDGVPGLFAPSTGPLRGGLVFRVGQVDEPLARRGITHLLEHLALHSAGMAEHHYNGVTAPEFTVFYTSGSADELRSFFAGVCASLRELPIDRLSAEKEILRAEAATRGGGATERMPIWRHGARDYGLTAYPEFGLNGLTADDLRAWTARYFVRGNAALWITGPRVPDDIRLDLPDGPRRVAPAASSALPVTPAYFSGPSGVVVWDAVVPRETASAVFADLLRRELHRKLRQEGGLSYSVSTDYAPRADGTALITAVADALPDKHDAVLAALLEVLERMRRGPVDDTDLAAVVKRRCEELRHADEQGSRVPGLAVDLLLGRSLLDIDELLARNRATTAAEVARVAAAAFATGLLQTPGDTTAESAGYAAVPDTSDDQVTGLVYPSLAEPAACRVILGDEGVSVIERETVATVRFDTCAAALAWPDGARRLIGFDGITVDLEPTMFHGLGTAIPALDRHLPTDARAEMAPRDPERIPRPRLRLPTIASAAEHTGPLPRIGPPPPHRTRKGYLINLVVSVFVVLWTASNVLGLTHSETSSVHQLPPAVLYIAGVLFLARGVWAVRGLSRLNTLRRLDDHR